MARSVRFRSMQTALNRLRRQFLPKNFDPTGSYSELVIARTRAYRVLSHAEVEYFLEERVREIANHALSTWNSSQKTCKALMSMIAYSNQEMKLPPHRLSAPSGATPAAINKHNRLLKLNERVQNSHRLFIDQINNNHGVREKNILRMLLPIGFSDSDIDPLWIVEMDLFGRARGEAAHTSYIPSTLRHPLDPQTEFTRVQNLLNGLLDVDEKLTNLKSI